MTMGDGEYNIDIGTIGRYLSYLWLPLFSSISGKGGGKKGKDMKQQL